MTREQLYEAVWSMPIVQLAKRYGLSDFGLAKVCKRHQVPRPGLEYWSKNQHGKIGPKPALPALEDPKLQRVSLVERPAPPDTQSEPERFAEDDEVNRLIIAEMEAHAVVAPRVASRPPPAHRGRPKSRRPAGRGRAAAETGDGLDRRQDERAGIGRACTRNCTSDGGSDGEWKMGPRPDDQQRTQNPGDYHRVPLRSQKHCLLIPAQICDMVSWRDLGAVADWVHEQVQSTDGRQAA